jgi:hypothetical protein
MFQGTMPSSSRRRHSSSSSSGKLVLAKLILFFVGMLTISEGLFGLRDAGDEVAEVFNNQTTQTTLAVDISEQDHAQQARQDAVRRLRFAYGVTVGIGVIFVACALLVERMPLISTITGLTLYLAISLSMAMVDPGFLRNGFILRILMIVALFTAVGAALRIEQRRKRRRRREEAEG